MNEFEENKQSEIDDENLDLGDSPPILQRLKLPLLIVVVLGIASAVLLLFNPGNILDKEVEIVDEIPKHEPPPFGQVFKIEDLIINPSKGRRHFIVTLGLEYFDLDATEEIKRHEPLLRDNLITLFSAQPVDVLTNIKYRRALRSRVKRIMDYQLGEGLITRIFFEKWVFQ